MRFGWLLFSLYLLADLLVDVFQPHTLPEHITIIVGLAFFQMLHSWILSKIFTKKKMAVYHMDIDTNESKITFTMFISEVWKRYPPNKYMLHEVLAAELTRFDKALKAYGHFDENDYEVFVNINEQNNKQLTYIIHAKSEKAKKVLLDIARSFNLAALF